MPGFIFSSACALLRCTPTDASCPEQCLCLFRIWFDWILLNGLHLLRGIFGPRKNFFQFSLLFFSVIDWDQGAVGLSVFSVISSFSNIVAFIGWESGCTWVAGLKGRWDSWNLSAPRSHPRFPVCRLRSSRFVDRRQAPAVFPTF